MDSETHKQRTGGYIAPVAFMHYDQGGRCVATSPEGGLTVLDQFALSVAGDLVSSNQEILGNVDAESLAGEAYAIARAMLDKKRKIERGED